MSDRSGSDTRQRRIILSARFNDAEAEAIRQLAAGAGVPVATYLRVAALNRPLRQPRGSTTDVARLVGEIGRTAQTLRTVAAARALDPADPILAAAMRDLADMRVACFEALGRTP